LLHGVRDLIPDVDLDVDYLKYDNCGLEEPLGPIRMRRMRDALLKQERGILFAICQGGVDEVWKWGNKTGHSWRISDDIWAYYPSLLC
jgi:alpha-galactosidase